MTTHIKRCTWVTDDPLYIEYHDKEWGIPVHDDQRLFEFLILEGMQAGLSWLTILKKRDAFRAAFDNFDANKIARYQDGKVKKLLNNKGIIRNRLKVAAAITNAQAFLTIQQTHTSFAEFIWPFVDGQPIKNHWSQASDIPTSTATSQHMSKALKQHGFKFVGDTICYAFMQAVGMVNDHQTGCFCYGAR